MPKIDEQTERRIKEAADIVSVASDFLQLQKEGENYSALCPFHDDRHLGSFIISPRRNICTCFSCGVHYDSIGFLMNYGNGMSYHDALIYLASKYGVPIEGEQPIRVTAAAPRQPLPDLPTLTFPIELVTQYMYTNQPSANPLVAWLKSLPWQDNDERRMLDHWLRLYGVGTSSSASTNGWTIWWQIDESMRVRTGKLMKYKSDGHRDKESQYNFNYIHSLMKKQGYWRDDEKECRPCLFGLHLLDCFPDAEVCIVESEKSAVIAQTFSSPGKKIFMATGSKSSLSASKLKPIIDRNRWIILYPDVDAVDEWKQKAASIGYDKMRVSGQVLSLYDKEKDSPKADIADILVRLVSEQKEDPHRDVLESWRKKSPQFGRLLANIPMDIIGLRRNLP